MTLRKRAIVKSVREKAVVTHFDATRYVEFVLEKVKDTLENGEDVLISGFGKFSVRSKRARRGRNPSTREDLTLGARRVVTFRCSSVLRRKLNGDHEDVSTLIFIEARDSMKKILVVDDREEIRDLVEMTLGPRKYRILKAESGEKALEIARTEIPDLILLDIEMPGGMDGLEVTRTLRNLPEIKDCPIIILTGSGVAGYGKSEGLKAGATGYFAKPFSPLALIKKVEELIK